MKIQILQFIVFSLFLLSLKSAHSQNFINADTITFNTPFENIAVRKLQGDKHVTTFIICVKKEVKLHKHAFHSETIYVLNGTGEMVIGEKVVAIKKGDVLFIPENTPHSVTVTSDIPLKVLSVQAPEFDGTDRILLE
jgi:mannose-6-phosphate isomerase-like protein (cupin superfamily)